MKTIKKLYESHRNNKKTGIIFLTFLTIWTLTFLLLPSIANPVYGIMYFVFITTIGFYFTLFLIILLYLWAIGHFFDNKLHEFLLTSHHLRKICIIVLGIIFLAQVSVIAGNGWIYIEGSFHYNMGQGAFGNSYINKGEVVAFDWSYWWTFGIIPYCFAELLGAWYFVPLAMILSMLLIIYGTLSLYTQRYDVWNHWSKNGKKAEDLDDDQTSKEDQSSKVHSSKHKKKVNKSSKPNFNKIQETLIEDLDNYSVATPIVADQLQETLRTEEGANNKHIVRNEQERLKQLKDELIAKRQQEKSYHNQKVMTELQKLALLRDLGEISPTIAPKKKTIDKKQETDIANSYELNSSMPVSFIETNIDKFSKAVNDDFNHELFEIFKKTGSDKNVEIPLTESYTGDIFKEAEKTLEVSLNLNKKEEIKLHHEISAETIIDPSKSDLLTVPIESTQEIFDLVDKAKKTVKINLEKKETDKLINDNLMNLTNIKDINWCQTYKKPQAYFLKSILQSNNVDKALREETIIHSGQLDEMFSNFKINANVSNYIIGPTCTMFEISLDKITNPAKILSLEDNIKLTLGAKNIRIQAPIPGKSLVGIEIPNKTKKLVLFKKIFEESETRTGELLVALGQNISGKSIIFDLVKTPHLLIAGDLLKEESNIIDLILISLIMRYQPIELKLMLIDSEVPNFTPFREIPHLISPIIEEKNDAQLALKSIIAEIDRRYLLITHYNVKNIVGLNHILFEKKKIKLPYLVVVINELADFMENHGQISKFIFNDIIERAQVVGIHLIAATSRPSLKVITEAISANFASKIALSVPTVIDSKIILSSSGAEKLIGNGDMLLSLYNRFPFRGQAAFITSQEKNEILNFIKKQCKPYYQIDIKQQIGKKIPNMELNNIVSKDLYDIVHDFALLNKKISIPMIQKKYNVGYNKATDIINILEQNGVVGSDNGSKYRKVLIRGDKND